MVKRLYNEGRAVRGFGACYIKTLGACNARTNGRF
ncbi:hypothetical protein RB2083_1402 [Rhodobacteraceae bacterium HTCC2083]|nr:hypothetical protein RB2083_1402 [Rhodobacteraceae bacterium HTCC2083]